MFWRCGKSGNISYTIHNCLGRITIHLRHHENLSWIKKTGQLGSLTRMPDIELELTDCDGRGRSINNLKRATSRTLRRREVSKRLLCDQKKLIFLNHIVLKGFEPSTAA